MAVVVPDIPDLFEEAYARAGVELRTGNDLREARRSFNILTMEWQNRGLNLWTIQEGSQAITSGTARYTFSGDVLDIVEAFIRTDSGDTSKQTDQMLTRISVSQFAHLTNKLSSSKPLQYWLEKDPAAISINLWPVPDSTKTYTLIYYYLQRVEDTGSPATNNVDIPSRYLPCMVAGLAYQISLKKPEAADRIPILKQVYEEQWSLAADADRDKSSLFFTPGGYRTV